MTHNMALTGEHEGTEEWCCSTCGRRLLVEWEPFRKVTLEPGDENAGHAVSKGGLRIGSIEINRGDGEGQTK